MTNIVLPEGVQYLASNGYIDHYTWGFRPISIIWIIMAIICFVCTIILASKDEQFFATTFLTFAGCVMGVILAVVSLHNTPVYYTEYWVIIEPHALYSQIYDEYSVADTKESITILHPKNPVLWNGEPN